MDIKMNKSDLISIFLEENIKYLKSIGNEAEIDYNVLIGDTHYIGYSFVPQKPIEFIKLNFDIEGKTQ